MVLKKLAKTGLVFPMHCIAPVAQQSGAGEREEEGSAPVGLSLGPDATAVALDDSLDDRQPDACALVIFGAVEALKEAEQRNTLAATIVADLQSRPDLPQLAPAVQVFLCGPWAQVLAQAHLTDRTAAADPGAGAGPRVGLARSENSFRSGVRATVSCAPSSHQRC